MSVIATLFVMPTLDMVCASDWCSLARVEGVEDAAQTVDLPEHALDYIIETCLDYCRDISSVIGGGTACVQVQTKAAAAGVGEQALVAALRRAAFGPLAPERSLVDGDSCSSQEGGWRIVAMQRSLL